MADDPNSKTNITTPQIDSVSTQVLTPTWIGRWREVLSYIFGITILYDFVLAPALVQVANAFFKASLPVWVPNTTQGGGLYFICMMAVLGVSAYGKMNERVEAIKNLPDYSGVPIK